MANGLANRAYSAPFRKCLLAAASRSLQSCIIPLRLRRGRTGHLVPSGGGYREDKMKATISRFVPLAGAAMALVAATTGAHALDPTPKWCPGVKIAAFPGGPQGGPFATVVYNGYRQAEADLGPKVTYYFSNWDPNMMLTQLQQAIATKVDGIAFMGHPGDDATDPLIDQAYKAGHHRHDRPTPRCPRPRPNTPRTASAMSARRTIRQATRSAPKRPSGPTCKRATRSSSGASRRRAATAASAPSA